MRTCCPTCQTVFRVTSEQLRLRAGKVRCGQCRAVFNAIDNLADDAGDALPVTAPAARLSMALKTA
ncbi:MAG TPA: zinc-ribbon domain-containing protein, partial [Candidatus Accumulibacter phosphatis]|nr:zinc-ribbon domain-containing protein [Candidatus Accumulibacter phosphatis]